MGKGGYRTRFGFCAVIFSSIKISHQDSLCNLGRFFIRWVFSL